MLGGPREYACFALAVVLIVAGTLATGLFPPGLPYQVVAGGAIVAGFAIAWVCLGTRFRE